ncbi:MAG TPA: glycosyl hydrolase [Actinomycetota bacterium]|nr:glycosyl hydrolase [Actinomycetota bacterium]
MKRIADVVRNSLLRCASGAVALAVAVAPWSGAFAAPQGVAPRTIRPQAKLVPSTGLLFGAFHDPDSRWSGLHAEKEAITRYERKLGRKYAIGHHFVHWYGELPDGMVRWDVRKGRIPMVSWEPYGASLRGIAAGNYDEMIARKARALRDLAAPVFLRWGHEMNGYWYPWGGPNQHDTGTTNGPAHWIAAYRHVHDVFVREGARNVVWVWGPNNESVPDDAWNDVEAYYPGDDYVDWVAASGFNWGTLKEWSSWRSFGATFRSFYRRFATRKPIMIAETASAKVGGSRSRWLREMARVAAEEMPSVAAIVYFNSDPRWVVRTDSRAFRAFRDVANQPHFNP